MNKETKAKDQNKSNPDQKNKQGIYKQGLEMKKEKNNKEFKHKEKGRDSFLACSRERA